MDDLSEQVTLLLEQINKGDQNAADKLVPLLYSELRRLAASYLRSERGDHTLQATALVNEAYLRLVNQREAHWNSRNHFFAIAAQVMRRILVDYARSHGASKRGGSVLKTPLEDAVVVSDDAIEELAAVDEVLTRLATIDAQQAHIVELRVFGGLTVDEIANLIGVSRSTVKRDWEMAKAWLAREMKRSAG
jgi:RNA polymerase sigma-70 factor (ECF subfamily)